MSPEYKARIEAAQPRLVAMAKETYGVEISPKTSVFDSRPALIGAKYAEAQGAGAAYHRAVMRAYWQEDKQIEERTVLADLAEELGLDRDAFLAALDDPAYDEQVQADIDQAQQYGLTGVPAIVFDMRYLIPGAQPHPVLADAVDQILAESNGNGSDAS